MADSEDKGNTSKTEEQLTAEENIEKMKRDALEKAKTDPTATLDPAKLIPEVIAFLALPIPSLKDVVLDLLKLFMGEEAVKKAEELGELEKLISDFLLGISAIIMTTISMISLLPLPNLAVIKMVIKIIQDFEAAKAQQSVSGEKEERKTIR